jgi:hypothetical protein
MAEPPVGSRLEEYQQTETNMRQQQEEMCRAPQKTLALQSVCENFNSVAPGILPAGWATSHAGGTGTVPWTTSNTFCGTGDPGFNILAHDGVLLRITDQTAGHLVRSEQLEAFADEFTTGSFENYPKHFPRSSNAAYFPSPPPRRRPRFQEKDPKDLRDQRTGRRAVVL